MRQISALMLLGAAIGMVAPIGAAGHIPNPASMCYDAGANQLVIPMNANNGLAFISLR
jgi:hypothetical protein